MSEQGLGHGIGLGNEYEEYHWMDEAGKEHCARTRIRMEEDLE